MGSPYKRQHPRLWSTTCLLCSKTDTWYWARAPGEAAMPALLSTVLAFFPILYSTLHWDFFVFSCLLYAVAFYDICHPLAELFIHSIGFFLSLLKLLLLTDPSLGTLVPDHLCALPVKMQAWTHYQFTWPDDFLSWLSCSDTPVPYSRPHWGCCHFGLLLLWHFTIFPSHTLPSEFPKEGSHTCFSAGSLEGDDTNQWGD